MAPVAILISLVRPGCEGKGTMVHFQSFPGSLMRGSEIAVHFITAAYI
jgi:hypothetical protein